MKKISVLDTLLAVVMFAFTGCEKEESTEKVLLKRQLTSYDGSSKFYFDSDFVNPFDQYGVNHNKLFQKFETIWTEYKKEDKLNAALFDYAIDKSEEITGLCLADAGLDKNEFRQYLCNSLRDKAEYAYIQTVNDFFSQFGIYFFPKFISDVEAFAYKTDNVDEGISQIKIIEQQWRLELKKTYPNGLILGSTKQQKNIMKSDLIIGSTFLIIGIALTLFCKPPLPQKDTKWWKSSLATLSYNGFISMLLLLGYLHLSMFCLNLKDSDITWKNGIYLFFSITALMELTYRIIIRLKRNGDK